MKAHRAEFRFGRCAVCWTSSSGYYDWLKRVPSARKKENERLGARIRECRRTYGRPRIHKTLREEGERASAGRVERLMRREGIARVSRRRGKPWSACGGLGFQLVNGRYGRASTVVDDPVDSVKRLPWIPANVGIHGKPPLDVHKSIGSLPAARRPSMACAQWRTLPKPRQLTTKKSVSPFYTLELRTTRSASSHVVTSMTRLRSLPAGTISKRRAPSSGSSRMPADAAASPSPGPTTRRITTNGAGNRRDRLGAGRADRASERVSSRRLSSRLRSPRRDGVPSNGERARTMGRFSTATTSTLGMYANRPASGRADLSRAAGRSRHSSEIPGHQELRTPEWTLTGGCKLRRPPARRDSGRRADVQNVPRFRRPRYRSTGPERSTLSTT